MPAPTDELVSVVIPTYNRSHTLGRALDSALGQTHGRTEVIVVDDASTDATLDLLKSLREPRLEVVTLAVNGGQCRARNAGIARASGRYVAFLDSDDEWLPDKLTRQLHALQRSPEAALAYTGAFVDDGTTRRSGVARSAGDCFEEMLALPGPLTTSGMMVNRTVAGADLYFDEDLGGMEEADLAIRLSRHHQIVRVADPLYIRHMHQGKRVSNSATFAVARKALIDKYAPDLGNRPHLAAYLHFRLAQTQLKANDVAGARSSLRTAAKLSPTDVRFKTLSLAAWAGDGPTALALRAYRSLGRLQTP